MLIGGKNKDSSVYPVWPYRLNPNWPLAQYAQGIYPGDPCAGNVGINPALTVPSPNTTNLSYKPPLVGDFNNAPSDIMFNLPRTDTVNDWWNLPGTGITSLHSDFTWACWVRITNDSQTRSAVLGSDTAFGSGTGLYLEQSATPNFRFYRGLWNDYAFTGTWNGYDVWHHLVVVNDGGDTGTDRIYMNGVRGTDNAARTMTATTQPIRIGTVGTSVSATTNRLMKGQVAHVVLLDKVVTDAEAWMLYDPSTRFSMYESLSKRKWFLPAASGGVTLTVSAISQSIALDAVALTQANVLSVTEINQSQALDNVDLLQGYTLSTLDINQSQSLDNVDLTQSHSVVVADITQSQTIDNIDLTQSYLLTVADISQPQALDSVVLSAGILLVISGINQSQLVDNIDLVQSNILSINSIDQSQTLDAVTLSIATLLAVVDISQSQIVDNVALTQANVITVNDANQSQTLDAVALTQANALVVVDVSQSHALDNIVLSTSVILAPNDITQSQNLDGVVLTTSQLLAVQDVLQSAGLDNVALAQGSVLTVASVGQSQTIDNIQWIVVVTPDARIYLIKDDARVYLIENDDRIYLIN